MSVAPRLIISATRGGLGKTTFSLGIIRAWQRQGKRVAVFKKGPDFIDAGWLGAAAGRPCYNLDPFMMEPETIRRSFSGHAAGADVSVIEGNRGLYDGVDESGTYSTARLSKLLLAPVVVIIDCTKTSGTVGAITLGLKHFDPETVIGGVILNNVSPGRHETVVRKAIEQSSGLRVLGAVPRQRKGSFPERHMGLTPFHEHPDVEQAIAGAARLAEQHLDLDRLWAVACSVPEMPDSASGGRDVHRQREEDSPVIGVIRDRAFQFYYPDNLEALEREGARLVEINALRDTGLPAIDALYIGGGFPETQAAELAANDRFCQSVRNAAERGMPIYAECGGLIYLGRSLVVGTKTHAMAGVLPLDFVLESRPQAHGYTLLRAGQNSLFLDKGVIIRGHEFHYSRAVNVSPEASFAYEVNRGAGIDGSGDGIVQKNVVAAYTHIHALATPEWAPAIVNRAREYRTRNAAQAGKQVVQ